MAGAANPRANLFSGLSRAINIETVDDTLLTADDEEEVVRALTPVQGRWRMIGRSLRIEARVLDRIEKNPRHRLDLANFLEDMVQNWLSLNYDYKQFGLPSCKLLVMAVAKGSGDNRHAIELANRYRYPYRRASQFARRSSFTDSIEETDKSIILESVKTHSVGRRWSHIARILGINMSVIHDIHDQCNNCEEQFERLITAWIDGETRNSVRSQASWEELLDAVAAPDGGNNVALAIKLARAKKITWRQFSQNSFSGDEELVLDSNCFKGLPEDSLGGDNSSPCVVAEDNPDGGTHPHEGSIVPDSPQAVVQRKRGDNSSLTVMSLIGLPGPVQLPETVRFLPYPSSWDPAIPNKKRGLAILFVIRNYSDPKLPLRKGAEKDASLFEQVFTKLGYEVLIYKNAQCSGTGIFTILSAVKDRLRNFDKECLDSFVCCFTAHGSLDLSTQEEFIVPYDYSLLAESPKIFITDLRKALGASTCPSLANKPKLFFIQACRGQGIPPATKLKPQMDSIAIHEDSDFFVSYSTRMTDASCRDVKKGSWYCQELAGVLLSDATLYYDVCTLVTEAHQRVMNNHEYEGFRQCPELTHTLRKRFFFFDPPKFII